ncbi:unnamed protein product [Microthlaspi erraticum]|uniref:F-box domain-containing protein n=1 Tax=Microthlaspi erraticum TaxID=1685480 RepID=A0A6D2IPU5_9BRAS|nr:unnamed protein product [Microthlaspi erraticum]
MKKMLELPEEMLEEILCRVPTLSLIRFRSTCKRWNRLFNDKSFRSNHLEKSPKQFRVIMLNEARLCLMRINHLRVSPIEVKAQFNLIDPRSRLYEVRISQVFHCDGLLLCVTQDRIPRLLVWNPCTGQTRWIKISIVRDAARPATYALGSYQNTTSNVGYSYKILSGLVYSLFKDKQAFEVYEMKSSSWRVLDAPLDFIIKELDRGLSLKRKTYWIADVIKSPGHKKFLVSFDYSTEIFEHVCLPDQGSRFETLSVSVVRDKIGETKAVSWSKILAVDICFFDTIADGRSFLVDEERKVLVCCSLNFRVHIIVGEDNNVRDYAVTTSLCPISLFSYVPSLTQIQQANDIGGKRKRGDE